MTNSLDLTKISNISSAPTFYKSNDLVADQPLFNLTKNIFYVRKNQNSKNQTVYSQFLNDLQNYSLKQPESYPKEAFNSLNSRDLIYLGKYTDTKSYSIPGGIILTPNNELAAIVLDMNTHKINSKTGITSHCDLAFYSIYFEYIRSSIICNSSHVSKDEELDLLLLKLLINLYLKILGVNITLNDKQKAFLYFDLGYFYYRFMKNQFHKVALSNAMSLQDSKYKAEAKYIIDSFNDKYTKMKDIFKSFIDFNILFENPAVVIMKTINKYNLFTFYCLTGSLDYLIGMIILARYSTELFPNLSINTSNQSQLESYIYNNYCKKLKYNVNFLHNSMKKSESESEENVFKKR